MRLVKKIILWTVAVLLGAVLVLGIAAGIQWYKVSRSDTRIAIMAVPSVEGGKSDLKLGERFKINAVFSLPWGVNPALLTAEPAEGSQLTAEPKFRLRSLGWGHNLWNADIPLQAYREGDIKQGTMTASFSNSQSFEFKLPPLKIKPVEVNSSDLALAAEMKEKNLAGKMRPWLITLVALLLVCLAVLAYLQWAGRKKARVIPPWEFAIAAIRDLLSRVKAGTVPPEKSIAVLTDIVREYMERRFELRAERQTTAEFMNDLEHGKGNLSDTHREFLRGFLNAADMVKFARVPADESLIENAALKAEALVNETTPAGKETGK